MSYQVTETRRGAYLVGPVPCSHLPGLAEIFKARGWDWLAFVSRESQALWRAELGIE